MKLFILLFIFMSGTLAFAKDENVIEKQKKFYLSCSGVSQFYRNDKLSETKPQIKGYLISIEYPVIKFLASEEITFKEFDCRLSEFEYACGTNYQLAKDISVNNVITFNRASGKVSQMISVAPNKISFPSEIFEGNCSISEKPKF